MIARSSIRALLLALVAVGVTAAPAVAVPAVSGEFEVEGLGSNNKIVQGPEGNMWVTLDGNNRDVAKITPAGVVTEYDLEAVTPLGITAGPKGLLWIARNGGVVSFDPDNPVATKVITDLASIGNSPSIVLGPDGNLWATGDEKLVRVPPDNPIGATDVPVTGLKEAKDIDVTGALIVVAGKEHIFAVTTAGTVVGNQKVGGNAQGVAGGPNGQYAFTQPVSPPKELGLLSPFAMPLILSAEGTDPFGITLGPDDAYWSPEFITDGLLRLTSTGQLSGLTGFAKESGPRQIAAGPGNTLWVTLEMSKKVGRVSGVDPPVDPPIVTPLPTPESPKPERVFKPRPRTQIKGGPKGRVTTRGKKRRIKFRFRSPNFGVYFQCRMKQLPKRKARRGFRSPPFRGCKSPRPYLLKPGRYRFEVRAVFEGGRRDLSPARRTFRIVRVGGS